jgi:hypothetical protein
MNPIPARNTANPEIVSKIGTAGLEVLVGPLSSSTAIGIKFSDLEVLLSGDGKETGIVVLPDESGAN